MFSISCLNGRCCARTRQAMTGPFPGDIRFISIYSPSDEIVRWKACLDDAATQIEVDVSHIGMGWARDVWLAVTDALGRTVRATV
jgi:triacylglycerol lipase